MNYCPYPSSCVFLILHSVTIHFLSGKKSFHISVHILDWIWIFFYKDTTRLDLGGNKRQKKIGLGNRKCFQFLQLCTYCKIMPSPKTILGQENILLCIIIVNRSHICYLYHIVEIPCRYQILPFHSQENESRRMPEKMKKFILIS